MDGVNILFVLLLLIELSLLSGCENRLVEVTRIDEKYTVEELNYFYEVAFHSEVDSKSYPLRKWNQNIKLFIEGDTLLGDRVRVVNAIDQLNALKLPVQLSFAPNRESANMYVSFGSRKLLNLDDWVLGIVSTTDSLGHINRAEIKIVTEPNETFEDDYRTNHILEEITQGLGIAGDSYAYPLSIFYEKLKRTTGLSTIDKKTLRLLYEPALTAGYRCEQFEKDFANQLYHINREEKFLRYVKEQAISKKTLQEILKYGLVTKKNNLERIAKFNYPIQVNLKGDTTREQKSLIQKAINELNQVSKQIKLILIPSDSLLHSGGIFYNFSRNDQQPYMLGVQMSVSISENLFFDKRYRAEIQINYKDTATIDRKLPLAIANSMYQAISLLNQSSPEFFTFERDSLTLPPEYQEILKLYYSNSLAENLTKEELQRVMDQIQE